MIELKKLYTFIIYTLIFSILIRIIVLSFFLIAGGSSIANSILYDPLHHYQYGIIIVVFALIFRRLLKNKFLIVLALGTSLILEEYTILLNDLNIKLPYFYLSSVDNISFCIFVAVVLMLTLLLRSKRYPFRKNI